MLKSKDYEISTGCYNSQLNPFKLYSATLHLGSKIWIILQNRG